MVSSTRAPATALTASVRRGQSDASAVSTVMSRIGVGAFDLDQVDRADRATGVADRARDLAQHARPVIDLDPEGEAVLSTGRWRHGAR